MHNIPLNYCEIFGARRVNHRQNNTNTVHLHPLQHLIIVKFDAGGNFSVTYVL